MNENSEDEIKENAFLQHIINRGREILKDRSNLHTNSEINTSLKTIEEITNRKMKEIKSKFLINILNNILIANNLLASFFV